MVVVGLSAAPKLGHLALKSTVDFFSPYWLMILTSHLFLRKEGKRCVLGS